MASIKLLFTSLLLTATFVGCGNGGTVGAGGGGVGGEGGLGGGGGEGGTQQPCVSNGDCLEGDYCSRLDVCDVLVGGECTKSSDCEFFDQPPRFEVCVDPEVIGKCFPQELLSNLLFVNHVSLARLDTEAGQYIVDPSPQLLEETWSFVGRWQFGEEVTEWGPREVELPFPDVRGERAEFWVELDWSARYTSVDNPDEVVVECDLTFLGTGEALGATLFQRVLFKKTPESFFLTPGFEVFCSSNDWQAGDPGLFVRYYIIDPVGDYVE